VLLKPICSGERRVAPHDLQMRPPDATELLSYHKRTMPWSVRTILIISVIGSLFELYVARKTITAIDTVTSWPRKLVRLSAIAVVLGCILYPIALVASYYLEINSVSRALQSSEMFTDKLLVYPFWTGIIFSAQVSQPLLLMDGIRLMLFPVYRRNKQRWSKIQAIVVILTVCVGFIYVVARIYSDTFTVRVRQAEAPVKSLPESLDGFRVVQIADVQVDARTKGSKLDTFIDRVNRLNPDLILICGDFVTSGTGYIESAAAAMGRLRSRYSVYACLGDHDFFSDHTKVTSSLQKNGVTVLDNAEAIVENDGASILINGITNVYRTRPSGDVIETLEKQRRQPAVNILLTHQPSDWLVKRAEEKHYDLFLAGHTHGGQIAFPLPGFLLTGSSFETSYVSGFYRAGSMLVSVTNGLGLTLAPVRYNAPAEITLITLRRDD
jgi:predicted MPP superfamily phosphohydrolase